VVTLIRFGTEHLKTIPVLGVLLLCCVGFLGIEAQDGWDPAPHLFESEEQALRGFVEINTSNCRSSWVSWCTLEDSMEGTKMRCS